MRVPIKITKYVLINSILLTFLMAVIVSCGGSRRSASSSKSGNNASSPHTSRNEHTNTKADKVVSTAKSYTGTKYKFGGTSRNGMDCSGLVYTSFKDAAGIELPRTSTEQSRSGKTVELDELQPGDLVFFTDREGHKKITHVGIITENKGRKNVKFIHASTKLGVVENDLYSEYYLPLFIKAVRIF